VLVGGCVGCGVDGGVAAAGRSFGAEVEGACVFDAELVSGIDDLGAAVGEPDAEVFACRGGV